MAKLQNDKLSGANRCGKHSKCEMINFDGVWDYECFCKKNHVSYASRQPESRNVSSMGFDLKIGGYRETCEPFQCTPETKRVLPGFQTDTKDNRYKVFIPEVNTAPMAWEAAKQEVEQEIITFVLKQKSNQRLQPLSD